MPDNKYVFEVIDWRGRLVRMTQRTYDTHVERHAEIPEYIQEAQATIADPDAVYKSDVGRTEHLYRFGLGRGIYARTYLVVVIHYQEDQSTGIVATYYCRKRRPKLDVLATRYVHVDGIRITYRQYLDRLGEAALKMLAEVDESGEVDDE